MCNPISNYNPSKPDLSKQLPSDIIGIIYSFSSLKTQKAFADTSKTTHFSLHNIHRIEIEKLSRLLSSKDLNEEQRNRLRKVNFIFPRAAPIGTLKSTIVHARKNILSILVELDQQTLDSLKEECAPLSEDLADDFKIPRQIALVNLNPNQESRSDQLFLLCCDLGLKRKFDAAFQTALTIPDPAHKSKTLKVLALALVQRGQISKAIEFVDAIPTAGYKAMIGIEFAGKLAYHHKEYALDFLDIATKAALTIADTEDREATLNEIEDVANFNELN